MFSWRITKYNPQNRDAHGIYLLDEWTAYSEIGKIIQGKKFTYEEYIKIENAYVFAIMVLMQCNDIEALTITSLEKNIKFDKSDPHVPEAMRHTFQCAANGLTLDKGMIDSISRLVLREKLWCKLESKNMFVHFGWDYYM